MLASGTALTLAQQDVITTALCNGGYNETSASTLALVHQVNQKNPLRSIWNEVLYFFFWEQISNPASREHTVNVH